MAKENKHITVIRLRLVRPIGCNENDTRNLLDDVGRKCDLIRNATLRYWLRWREDNPTWLPDAKLDKDGNARTKKTGEVIRVNLPAPSVDGVTFPTAMYRHGRTIEPSVGSNTVSQLTQHVWKRLKQKAIWAPGKRAFFTWESILNYEESCPTYRSRNIPLHNATLKFGWDDCCWLEFPLQSSGCDITRVKYELLASKLPRAKKQLLQAIIAGEVKKSDSSLVRVKNRWELHLVVSVDAETNECDKSRVLVLRPNGPDAKRPFTATWPEDSCEIGSGLPLIREHERLIKRRKAIRGARTAKGHGSRRVMRSITSESRRYKGVQDAFHCDLADRLYRVSVREKCGTIIYCEPAVKCRDKLWFASKDTPFDWTSQLNRLVGKFKRRGFNFDVKETDYGNTKENTDAA